MVWRMELPPLLGALREVLARRGTGVPAARRGRRTAAVLVPFFHRDGALNVLMFRRTNEVPTHKGQVAFPGGSTEPSDNTLLDTALREAHEEVGIVPDRVEVLGPLQPFDTRVSDFVVHPFVGYLRDADPGFTSQPSEVDQLLELPVDALRDPRTRHWGLVPGFNVPIPLTYYRVGDTVVWGASGGIMGELLEALDEAEAGGA